MQMWNTDLDQFLEEWKVRPASHIPSQQPLTLSTGHLPVLGRQGHRAGSGREEEQAQAADARRDDEEGSKEGGERRR